jgi:thiol:disulfide interchange protein DsbD
MIKAALAVLLVALGLWLPTARAVDPSDLLPVDEAYVLKATAQAPDRLAFTWTIAKGYYLYRHRFSAQLIEPGAGAGALQIPSGDKHHDQFFGDVETYRGTVTATLPVVVAPGLSSVKVKVKYQGCADIGLCYPPLTRVVTVALPAGFGTVLAPVGVAGMDAAPPPGGGDPLASLTGKPGNVLAAGDALPEGQAFKYEAIAQSPGELLVRLTPAPGYYLYRDKTRFRLPDAQGLSLGAPALPPGKSFHDEHFGDVSVWFGQVEIPVPVVRQDTSARSVQVEASFQGCLTDGICYPPMTRVVTVELPAGAGAAAVGASVGAASAAIPGSSTSAIAAEAASTAAPTGLAGLLPALLLALFGGLVLNLMPCVLPVLSFKALGLAQASRSHAHARAHALWYTAGVLATFALIGGAVLALRGAGQALGWGFQLQQPWLVATLSLLMFAIGLSLSGLFQVGARWAGVGQSLTEKSGATGDFFTGVLAVVVASPCTAPFMAGALGYAFTAPTAAAMGVFLMLGLGLALPFLLIGFVPALAARLPRPGAWMDTLKLWLAYPMYLTAVWLLWVFGKQRGMDAVAALLVAAIVLALGLWWFERQRFSERRVGKAVAWLLVALALAVAVFAVRLPAQAPGVAITEGRVAFSRAALARLRAAHTPVFIDMTADWCITCKVNERAVFDTDAFRALLARTHTAYMVGDWTNEDPAISAFLDEYHSPGVPLYVVYPADGGPGVRLPQVLSQSTMARALEAAAAKSP